MTALYHWLGEEAEEAGLPIERRVKRQVLKSLAEAFYTPFWAPVRKHLEEAAEAA